MPSSSSDGQDRRRRKNCDAILQPLYTLLGITADDYPEDKAADRCTFSHNAFYLTNELPHGATIFRLTELTDKTTGTYFFIFSGKGFNGNTEHTGVIEVVR